ncbi:MAG TPA: cupredoxin domain-containing protein [Vicinamibacterales bacterium]|jgi:cytochrome c oxidase subunit 2|nr:cupredoxin domain-containing protein [Vicinamibacterales bacterium]
MSVRRRVRNVCRGIFIVMVVLAPRAIGASDQPVHEVQIVASKFMFEPSTIQVTAGETVRLIVRSKDGTHGFSIPKLKIDVRVPKTGEPVTVELTAPPEGRYEIACSEFCGSGHGQMKAALISNAAVITTS